MTFTIQKSKLSEFAKPVQRAGEIALDSWLADHKHLKANTPLKVKLTAEAIADRYVIDGEAESILACVCSRCLDKFTAPFTFTFREQFVNTPQSANEEEQIFYIAGDKIDLMPYIEENFHLALPYAPICRNDCQGLCPQCGMNRNEQTCQCEQDQIDPRLAGLKDFFNK